MPESFEDRDLSDSVFWGVNLQRSLFRDTDLSDATFFHVFLKNVSIDGEIDRLVINGVDVTAYVNEHDRWWPLRNNLSPDSVDGIIASWATVRSEWKTLLASVADAGPTVVNQSVNGEWSLNETLRHLIFAMDKWFSVPLLGHSTFNALGLPNTSSQDRNWPGLDIAASADIEDVLQVRGRQHQEFEDFLSSLRLEDLPETVSIEENGPVPALMSFHVVLEEEFEHLRYMVRDLATLGVF